MKYIGLLLIAILYGCSEHNTNAGLSQQDTLNILSKSFHGKYVREILREHGMSDGKIIYIVTDSNTQKKHWPEKVNNYSIKVTDSFNVNRNFIQQGQDSRFLISEPIFKIENDTLAVSFHSYSFYMRHEFKFIEKHNEWIKVYEEAYNQ
jgi:hypothetical protein